MSRTKEKVAHRVARRFLYGYTPEGEWEKMIASTLIEQTGIDDAEQEFFELAMENIADEMEFEEDKLEDMDPGDMEDGQYDDFVRGVMEAADEAGLIE